MAYSTRLMPHFIEKTLNASNLERLKIITTYVVATMPLAIGSGTKPFNPILGETFQVKSGNTKLYYEQTSHHPPVLNYYGVHPSFTSFGHGQLDVTSGPNSMEIHNNGKHYLKYNDGTLYRIVFPNMLMSGLVMGKRYMNFVDNFVIEDLVKLFH